MALKNQNTYIMSFQAKTLYYAMDKNQKKGYSTKGKKRNKLYSCSLPWSLDVIKLDSIKDNLFYQQTINKKEKQYCDVIVNVTFKNPYYEVLPNDVRTHCKIKGDKITLYHKHVSQVVKKLEELRTELYKYGFNIDGKHYVMYKRSSAKARLGSCLFILKKYHDRMIKWSRMGLTFEKNEKFDLASMKAYESLTLSSLVGILQIKPEEILLIKDVSHPYESISSVMTLKDGEPQIKTDDHFSNKTDIWDGQSLLDESMFALDKDGKQKGMMLLRNRFFKSCAFNTKLQMYFQNYYGDGYETQVVQDMCGNDRTVKNIKLVITPNSLKLFKFQDKLCSQKKCYKYWLKYIQDDDCKFGICKSEKESHYFNGDVNRLAYQMINSMDFSPDEIKGLVVDEVKYVMALKNNLPIFVHHISDSNVSSGKEFICNLLAINSNAAHTDLFKTFRTKTIDRYIHYLKCGKIKIRNCDYAVLLSNPYEMLRAAVGEEITDTLHHKFQGQQHGTEVWCPKFKDGDKLWGFRNPHICAGNCAILENKWFEELNYFNLTENIVIINTFDNDLADRLQGADEDSDVMLIGNSPLIYQKALECQKYPTPVKNVDLDKTLYTDSPENNANIDNIICSNDIGRIVNCSRLLNSYYWNMKSKGDTTHLNEIYEKVSILSSMSQLAIDRAKKYFNDNILDIDLQLSKMYHLPYILYDEKNNQREIILKRDAENIEKAISERNDAQGIMDDPNSTDSQIEKAKQTQKGATKLIKNITTKIDKARIVPLFVAELDDDNSKIKPQHFNCPMDYLQDALNTHKKSCKETGVLKEKNHDMNTMDFSEILIKYDSSESDNIRYRQVDNVIQLGANCKSAINAIWHLKIGQYQKQEKIKLLKDNLVADLSKIRINAYTMCNIIWKLYVNSKEPIEDVSIQRNKKLLDLSEKQDGQFIEYVGSDKDKKPLKLADVRALLYDSLWKAHSKEMEKCFKNNEGKKIPKLVECDIAENVDLELNFWGQQYKIIEQ
jgi:hypothetical protein